MSCSPFDLRDYFFQELAPGEARQVSDHLNACFPCRHELERLRITRATLATLPEEEVPQRIAFVSDPVFEPSPLRRFWRDFWGSAARLGFASAAVLSAALVFFASHRPAPVASVAESAVVAQRVEAAVQKAVAETEARGERKMAELLAAVEERHARQREADLRAVDDQISVLQKRYNVMLLASNDFARGNQ